MLSPAKFGNLNMCMAGGQNWRGERGAQSGHTQSKHALGEHNPHAPQAYNLNMHPGQTCGAHTSEKLSDDESIRQGCDFAEHAPKPALFFAEKIAGGVPAGFGRHGPNVRPICPSSFAL